MLYARRAARFFERLANPDEQAEAPKGVLLYSPNLLRFVAVLCYVILLLGYINNFFISDFFRRSFSDATMREIFYAQSVLVFIGAIGTGLVVYFARTHYRACMLFASMLAVSSSMVAIAFMYGLNVNPHLLLAVTPLLLIGFTVGRDGLLLVTLWIVANYVFLYLGDAWGWWPRPTDTTVDIVKHENLSAFIIVLLIVTAVEFYIVKIAVTLRKQGELHRALEEDQQERVELLSRLVTAKDEERQQLAHALHEGPVQDLVALRYGVWNAMERDKLVEIIDAATLKLRTVSRDLHPSDLELYGLPSTLDRLAKRQGKESDIEIDVGLPDKVCANNEVARVLYRIAQEALNNFRYHSSARRAWLNLEESDHTIALEVRDDGHGFDVEPIQRQAVEAGHFGLATLHELTAVVKGELEISSRPGEGTTVKVTVPVDRFAEGNTTGMTEQHEKGA
jgi:signal transduction histidine kinase